MIFRRSLIPAFLCLFLSVNALAADQQLRALILSGKNNHDWKSTTQVLKKVLEQSERFSVRVLEDPSLCDENMLKDVDVIISNWNNFPAKERVWGPPAENAIMEFVRSGKGFALVHAASACFPSWPEYQQLAGATWGEKTGHGPYHAFNVVVTDTAHPVTRVIGNFITEDELWHRMDRRPETHVLCTAYSDTARGGTGQYEPVAYSTEFGRGRGFYLVLGHDARAMLNPSWAMLLLRGAEWAATGEASIELPGNVPRMLERSIRSADTSELDLMAGMQQLIQSSSRNYALKHELARDMASLLQTSISLSWKKFFCEQLSLIGTREEVPALARLLVDSSLGFRGRFALERIPDASAVDAMRNGITTLAGLPRVGLTNALGERKDPQAVEVLMKEVTGNGDQALKGAAIHALGKIGGSETVRALENCPTDGYHSLILLRSESLLRCAGSYEDDGKSSEAAEIYKLLNIPGEPAHTRAAAFAGLVRLQPAWGHTAVAEAMKSGDEALCSGVVRVLREARGKELAEVVMQQIGRVPVLSRAGILCALADIGDSNALPEIYKALASGDGRLRASGLYGIGKLGDSSSVNRLCAMLGKGTPREQAEARTSLVSLRGKGVNGILLSQLKARSTATAKQEIIAVLAARDCRDAVPTLLKTAKGGTPEESKAAIKALGSLAAPATSAELADMLASARFSGQRATIVKALVSLGNREQSSELVCSNVLSRLPACPPEARESMFRVLAEFGGDKAYRAVRSALNDPDPVTQAGAIRALSSWPDSSPLEDLLDVAHKPGSTGTRLLAMRGGFALLEKPNSLTDGDRLKVLERELQRAESSDGKRLLISILGKQTSLQALQLAASCLSQSDIVDEAAVAVAGIARSTSKDHPQETRGALKKALESSHSPSVAEQVRPLLVGLDSQVDKRRTNNE
jgi:uncharacterized protein